MYSIFITLYRFDWQDIPEFKNRIESFDGYYKYIQEQDECNLFQIHKWIQFFVLSYNNIKNSKKCFCKKRQILSQYNISKKVLISS